MSSHQSYAEALKTDANSITKIYEVDFLCTGWQKERILLVKNIKTDKLTILMTEFYNQFIKLTDKELKMIVKDYPENKSNSKILDMIEYKNKYNSGIHDEKLHDKIMY